MEERKVQFRCLKQDFSGKGIVNYKNKNYRFPNLVVNEEAMFKVEKFNQKEPLKLDKIVKYSTSRCNVNCKNFGTCPICTYSHLEYAKEVELKEAYVKDLFAKIRDFKFYPTVKALELEHYQNKANLFATKSKANKFSCGLFSKETNSIFTLTECDLQNEAFNKLTILINRIFNGIEPYDSKTKKGVIKSVLLRYTSKETMVIINTNGVDLPRKEVLVKELINSKLNVTNVIQNYAEKSGSKFVDKTRVLYGQGYIFEEYSNIRYRISAKSFYDTNTKMTFELYNHAISLASITVGSTSATLFSQVGLLPILLSKKSGKVYAQDSNKSNFNDLETNLKLNKVKNVETISLDASKTLKDLKYKKIKIDNLFVEPSDLGLSDEFIEDLIKLNPKRLVYIAHDAKTSEHDTYNLGLKGYSLKKLQIVDTNPRTFEISSILVFESRISDSKVEQTNRQSKTVRKTYKR